MASLAEMERELIVERTRAGLEVARQLGRTGGRKLKLTDSKIKAAKKLLASGVSSRDVAAKSRGFRANALQVDFSIESFINFENKKIRTCLQQQAGRDRLYLFSHGGHW